MSDGVKTPDEILDKFINMKPEPDAADPEGIGGIDEAARGLEQERQESLSAVNDFLKWIVETADGQAKQQGYPGCGKVPPEKFGELLGIVAERNMPEKLIRKAPEMAAISIGMGILGVNLAHHRKMQLSAQQQPEQTGEGESE